MAPGMRDFSLARWNDSWINVAVCEILLSEMIAPRAICKWCQNKNPVLQEPRDPLSNKPLFIQKYVR
jgi:hypothetical protein